MLDHHGRFPERAVNERMLIFRVSGRVSACSQNPYPFPQSTQLSYSMLLKFAGQDEKRPVVPSNLLINALMEMRVVETVADHQKGHCLGFGIPCAGRDVHIVC